MKSLQSSSDPGNLPSNPTTKSVGAHLANVLVPAAEVLCAVWVQHQSLNQALTGFGQGTNQGNNLAAVSSLVHTALRSWAWADATVQHLANTPRLQPDALHALLALSLSLLRPIARGLPAPYQAHTVVDCAVEACNKAKHLRKAKGLVNAVLRNFLRNAKQHLEAVNVRLGSNDAGHAWPRWWADAIHQDHPESTAQAILEQSLTHPPMVLRVNSRVQSVHQYVEHWYRVNDEAGLERPKVSILPPLFTWAQPALCVHEPVSVEQLPGFAQGHVSVQDSAAQLAAPLLNPKPGSRVLDACAAPGGKTGHLLEWADIDLLALDVSSKRMQKVLDNVTRLAPTFGGAVQFRAQVASAQNVQSWWDGAFFDAVLADVPCTGSGVVRRHPDIPWLRNPADVANLSHQQHEILSSLWSVLAPGGTLLMVTCSVFAAEGPLLVQRFLEKHPDAVTCPEAPGFVLPKVSADVPQPYLFSPDGFYYAKFIKT